MSIGPTFIELTACVLEDIRYKCVRVKTVQTSTYKYKYLRQRKSHGSCIRKLFRWLVALAIPQLGVSDYQIPLAAPWPSGRLGQNPLAVYYILKIEIHSSCEIEYFVETHICKLCVILRSRSI